MAGRGTTTSVPSVAVISGPVPLIVAQEIIVRVTGGERVIHAGEGEAAWQAAPRWLNFDCGVAVDAGTGSLASGFNRKDVPIFCQAPILVLGMPQRLCPISGITSTAILHAVMAETVERLMAKGFTPPVYLATNVRGGDE